MQTWINKLARACQHCAQGKTPHDPDAVGAETLIHATRPCDIR
jgi:hypothetical protein